MNILNLSNDDLIKIITVLITTISAYIIAKYNSNTPKSLEIKQHQFDNVYLPIYKILISDLGYDIDRETAKNYAEKIKPILWDNYELVYPELHKLFQTFYFSANSQSDDYQKVYNEICYQVKIDYNLLKKSLGYPCENYLGLFLRMDIESKFIELLGWINVILILGPIILIFFTFIPVISDNLYQIMLVDYTIFIVLFLLETSKNRRHN